MYIALRIASCHLQAAPSPLHAAAASDDIVAVEVVLAVSCDLSLAGRQEDNTADDGAPAGVG
jgi:hypothetical protein